MNYFIVTNNPMVRDEFFESNEIVYFDMEFEELLNKVKRYCEEGHKLLTHPLSGSVKPKETPYKSILISKEKKDIDMSSLNCIINCIDSCKKFDIINHIMNNEKDTDFQLVDLSLITSALMSADSCNI